MSVTFSAGALKQNSCLTGIFKFTFTFHLRSFVLLLKFIKNILLSHRNHPFVKRHNDLIYVTKFNVFKRLMWLYYKTFAFSFNLFSVAYKDKCDFEIIKYGWKWKNFVGKIYFGWCSCSVQTIYVAVMFLLFFCTTANQVEDRGLFVLICLKWQLFSAQKTNLPNLHLLAQTLYSVFIISRTNEMVCFFVI